MMNVLFEQKGERIMAWIAAVAACDRLRSPVRLGSFQDRR